MTDNNITSTENDYNRRLFGTSWIRRKYHMARFDYIHDAFRDGKIDTSRFLELGCFDGRLLDHIPTPEQYFGIDANVENGLDLAKKRFLGDEKKSFIESRTPKTLHAFEDGFFSAFACLETFEHIEPDLVIQYLECISRLVKGDIIITVPNEKGPVLLIKRIAKWIVGSRNEPYTSSELFFATIGRMNRVKRKEHKGFDFATLVLEISKHFDIVSVTGLPFKRLPPLFNLTVAIHARSKIVA